MAMKLLVLGLLLLQAAPIPDKPLPMESQVKLLKDVRLLQQLQLQIVQLQQQAKELQADMEAACREAAASEKVDLKEFNCDIDKLTFVAKPKQPPAAK